MRQQAINAALRIAAGEVGVKELNLSNTGKRVREYQAATTLGGTGWAWCAAFIAWSLARTADAIGAPNFWINSASCDLVLAFARERNLLRSKPKKGDVGLVMKTGGDAVHIFLVEDVSGDVITSLEGNTNLTGSANGDGVYRLTSRRVSQRRKSDFGPKYLFIDWPLLIQEADKPEGYTLHFGEGGGAVLVGGKAFKMPLIENRSYVPVRLWGTRLGFTVEWDNEDQVVVFVDEDGRRREVIGPTAKLDYNGDGNLDICARLVDLAASAGLAVSVDEKLRRAYVLRPKKKG